MPDLGVTVDPWRAPSRALAQRYTILGTLGSGAMGVVYHAYDRWLGRDVALKRLRRGTGTDLYRFKREFRALADLVHPNLVVLHEMHAASDEWVVSMELVDGVPFIEWVRHDPGDPAVRAGERPPRTRLDILRAPLDVARLEAALPQLVDGVMALHVCGKLHRDLKPSNVLVTREGRVVLLDFGLIADLHSTASEVTHRDAAVGTPVYMSPEQAADLPLTCASDWYAVGAMLYEALTGVRPFEGQAQAVVHRKQAGPPPSPRTRVPSVSPQLDALCMGLLAREPSQRPDGRIILAMLGRQPMPATAKLERAGVRPPFVGRTEELAALRQAFTDAQQHPVAVVVRGDSGIGKTRLVRQFVDESAGDATVLEGRCYLRETVPFRAVDGVIDALTGALLRLPAAALHPCLTPEIAALARLFPVLHRVGAVAEIAAAARLPVELHELRRRAVRAMRSLCSGLAAIRPLVITVDDVQWGDADSAAFLADLLAAPEPPPILLVLVQRAGDDDGFTTTVTAPRRGLAGLDLRSLELAALSDDDARALASSIDGDVDTVVREARGHPLFLVELAGAPGNGPAQRTIEALIAGRVAALPAEAAALLRVVAVAARPLPIADAARVAGLPGVGTELPLLITERLVRLRHLDISDATYVEAYHDRVRAAVVASLTPTELGAAHEALRRDYERSGAPTDLDALAAHCLGAGDPARAADYAVRAAAAADEVLAFHRAAELYGLALSAGAGGAAERRNLHCRRAAALANAGRLDEAVAAYAEAARGADGAEAIEIERRRLEQLLRRGRLTEGMALGRRLLETAGIDVPATRRDALRAMALPRAELRRAGYPLSERATTDRDELHRVDLLAAVSVATSVADPLVGCAVQHCFIRDALAAGDPRRACIALTAELGYLGLAGAGARGRIAPVAARVDAMVARLGDPYLTGLASAIEGLVEFESGAWRAAQERLERGIAILCEHAAAARWEIDVSHLFHLAALANVGETRDLVRLVPRLVRDAVERGDTYAEHALRSWRPNLAWLVMGRPDDARGHIAAVEAEQASADEFLLRDYYQLASHVQIDLYTGNGADAWRRIEGAWPSLAASDLLCIQSVRVEARFLRARAALAAAATLAPAQRSPLLAVASDLAARLGRERGSWARGLALLVRALAIAAADGSDAAVPALETAALALDGCDMRLHATAARLRRGCAAAGTAGELCAGAARDAMRAQAIADPDAMTRLLCP